MLGAIELGIRSYMCSYKACSSLGLDVIDSVDTLLGCAFTTLCFFFFFQKRCWL